MIGVPEAKEPEQIPEVLWRAFTVNPEELSIERLSQPLVPGTSAEDDPTRIGDGNELGVYMSTNKVMVEYAYAHSTLGLGVPAPRFNDRGLIVNKVELPQCGVIVNVSTHELPIRKPQISPVLQGHYNNGFEGDEWIADEVPPKNYHVSGLVLSRWPNDANSLKINMEGQSQEEIQKSIDKIKSEFEKRRQKAKEFAAFLETLTPEQRLREFIVRQIWSKHEKSKEQ